MVSSVVGSRVSLWPDRNSPDRNDASLRRPLLRSLLRRVRHERTLVEASVRESRRVPVRNLVVPREQNSHVRDRDDVIVLADVLLRLGGESLVLLLVRGGRRWQLSGAPLCTEGAVVAIDDL